MIPAQLTVAAELIASLTVATPDRIRRRLDRAPDAADDWNWHDHGPRGWMIVAGEETVTLKSNVITSLDHVSCSCLLSPNCFHVLACLMRLSLADASTAPIESANSPAAQPTEQPEAEEEIGVQQKRAVEELTQQIAQVLHVGVAQSGVLVQAGLIRAVHQCRAEGLHRLAAIGLQIVTGVREHRSHAFTADAAQLAIHIADLLETCRHLQHDAKVSSLWVGTARRKQFPIRTRKLYGLFAEPILTRTGFSGAAVYLLGDDNEIYVASDVKPGGDQQIRDTYHGGIEIGSVIQPAMKVARSQYIGSELTASSDGRLGRGKGIKIAEQGASHWHSDAIQARFQISWFEQRDQIYRRAMLPTDARSAGWDFVFLAGSVVGATGPELILQLLVTDSDADTPTQFIRLAIENDHPSLFYRENLRLLSHAPGLKLQLIGRLNPQDPRCVQPLVIAAAGTPNSDTGPKLEIPALAGDRICLGFDEIQRTHLTHARTTAMILSPSSSVTHDDPLKALRRVWIASMLSGHAAIRSGTTRRIAAEVGQLKRIGYATGAAMLHRLSSEPCSTDPRFDQTFLATAAYLRACDLEFARQQSIQHGGE